MSEEREKRKGRKGCAGMKTDELAHGLSKDCILQGEFKRGKKKGIGGAKVYRSQAVLG